jgi:hypothetical protein
LNPSKNENISSNLNPINFFFFNLHKKSGLEYYYKEQGGNFLDNSMKSASDSAIYFKKELQKYFLK